MENKKMGKFTENKERTLTQAMFTRRLSGSMGITYDEAERIVSEVKRELIKCMLDGLCVKWRGFGTFGAIKHKGRIMQNNIFTGGKSESKDHYVVKFRASDNLNRLLNQVINRSFTFAE